MVANASNYNFSLFWHIDIFNQWHCHSSIYLFFILMSREKALESIIAIALASLIASMFVDKLDWLIYLSVFLLSISFLSKKITVIISKGWYTFSNYFGIMMNYIILFIIFYLFLCPLSFFQRLTGNNHILKKRGNNSYFIIRNHQYSNKDIENPW